MIYIHLLTETEQQRIKESPDDAAATGIENATITDYQFSEPEITGCVVGAPGMATKVSVSYRGRSFITAVWKLVEAFAVHQGINVTNYVCGWRVKETIARLTLLSLKEKQPIPEWAKTDLTKNYSTVEVLSIESLYHQNVYNRKRVTPELPLFLRDMGFEGYEKFICPDIDGTSDNDFIALFNFFNELLANYGYGHLHTNRP